MALRPRPGPTFHAELGRVPDLPGLVGRYACEAARVVGGQVGDVEEAGVLVELGHAGGVGQAGQGFPVLEPVNAERGVAPAYTAHGARAHALGEPLLELKRLYYGRNWKKQRGRQSVRPRSTRKDHAPTRVQQGPMFSRKPT